MSLVSLEKKGAVALVTMRSPATMNAMDQDLGPQLARGLETAERLDGVGAVVLFGAGGVFSAGGNLARARDHLADHPGAAPVFAAYTVWVHRVLAALTSLSLPVVSAVEGAASGAGLGWMMASDVVVCDQAAKLVPGFIGAGLPPGAGVSLTLPRLVGLKRAAQLLMTNRPITPQEALDWGLVDELAPAAEVLPRALARAGELAQGPAEALAATKALLHQAARQGLLPQAEAERKAVLRAADLPEFRRRVNAFMDRKRRKEA